MVTGAGSPKRKWADGHSLQNSATEDPIGRHVQENSRTLVTNSKKSLKTEHTHITHVKATSIGIAHPMTKHWRFLWYQHKTAALMGLTGFIYSFICLFKHFSCRTAGFKSVSGRSCDRSPRHRFFFISVSESECWDGSQDSTLLLHAPHVALPA
jgi:hypothetical protein